MLHSTYGDLQDPISLVIKTSHFAVYPYKRSVVIRQAIWWVSRHILKLVKEGVWAFCAARHAPSFPHRGQGHVQGKMSSCDRALTLTLARRDQSRKSVRSLAILLSVVSSFMSRAFRSIRAGCAFDVLTSRSLISTSHLSEFPFHFY